MRKQQAQSNVEAQARKIEEAIRAAALRKAGLEARDSLLKFTQFMRPDPNAADDPESTTYTIRAHHRALAEALEKIENGRFYAEGYTILAISIGPQKGKSELCSRMFPAWYMGRNPQKNLILGTYGDNFAQEFGADVRGIMESSRYSLVFNGVNLDKSSRAKEHMKTVYGGRMSFVGRGGAGTGKPADLAIVDDPIKNAEEAKSLLIRDLVWNWFTRVLMTRTHGMSSIAVIQTRWDEDDLIGRLTNPKNPHYQEDMAKRVLYINLPSIVESPEMAKALGVPVGGSIWEERFPVEMLKLRRKVDPIGFDAMEMGRPTPPEGKFFKRDQMVVHNDRKSYPRMEELRFYGSGDLALAPERNADASCVGTVGIDSNDHLWLMPEIYWEKKAADDSVEAMIDMCLRYRWMQYFSEKGVIARGVGPFLQKIARERGATALVSPTLFPAVGTKGWRAQAIRGHMTAGRVHFPGWATWWPRALEQMLNFDESGDNLEDDFVDMLAGFGQGLLKTVRASAPQQSAKVVKIGTLAWCKQQHNAEREHERRRAALRGW